MSLSEIKEGKQRYSSFSVKVLGQSNVYIEKWLNINGTTIHDLLNNTRYPKQPNESSYQELFYFRGTGALENYGARLRAYFVAPETGNYTFLSWCDDTCQLFLSLNVNPLESRLILHQTGSVQRKTPFGER